MILAIICAAAFFLHLGANGLFDLDEALYANAAREMVLRGDYISPRVNGSFFFEKPPFIYWLAALFFHVLGISELAARLPSALASSATTFLIYTFGVRKFGLRGSFYAGAFFALSPIVVGAGRQLTTDATLTLCITCATMSFFLAHTSDRGKCKNWYYGFWAACGCGVLTKGAPGIILPAAIVLIYLGVLERFSPRSVVARLFEMKPLAGLALFLLISIPWHVAAWRGNGEPFYQEYILRQHLQRFRGGDEAHRLPIWFYVPGFVLGFMPWSVFAVPALLDRHGTAETNSSDSRLFLKVWFWVVFLVFSVSGSKLISYILPLYPAAALLAGDWCARAAVDAGMRRTVIAGGLCALALTGIVFLAVTFYGPLIRLIEAVSHQPARVGIVPSEFLTLAQHLFGVGAAAMVVFVVMAAFGTGRSKADPYRMTAIQPEVIEKPSAAQDKRADMAVVRADSSMPAAFNILTSGMAVFVLVAVLEGLPAIDRQFSAPLREAARSAAALARPGEPVGVFVGEPRRPSIFFYLPSSIVAPNGGASRAVETTAPAKVGEYLQRPGHQVIIADSKRAAIVERASGMRVVHRSGPWTIFEGAN